MSLGSTKILMQSHFHNQPSSKPNNMKLPTLFKVVRSLTTSTKNKTNDRPPTYHTTGQPIYEHSDYGVVECLAQRKSMLNDVVSSYSRLQKEYQALPLHLRRDLHTPANEELVYAAAILEPDPKNIWAEISPHGNDELRPVTKDWYTSIGQLLHDMSHKDIDRFSRDYITNLLDRVDAEVTRFAKVQQMVDYIEQSASPEPSTTIEIILDEWNDAMKDIIHGSFVSLAVADAVKVSQQPTDVPAPCFNGRGVVEYFQISIDQPLWPSANDVVRGGKPRPAPRWRDFTL
ncbi:hypothetical protein PRZ48_009032 [Zasmidium cellare]|uniref:Uncharacterized protein n=1 Tax=Zasmidium cellare TaxID=395010 RepID=A0ABR0EH67_ZASCE|nr:hypothetical protein PRZ48_009032 [Zasmidium cellare]